MKELNWYKLYSDSWQGEIVPEAFSHPAKYSRALIRKIYSHMLESGWIKPGDKVIDPFGGVALGAYHAMQNGLVWCGCELEPKFVDLGNQNIALWNGRYSQHFAKWGTAVLIQGDSRNLAKNIQGEMNLSLSSPPFSGDKNLMPTNGQGVRSDMLANGKMPESQTQQSNGNLALLRASKLDFAAVVSSSPYADTVKNGEGTGVRHDPNGHKGDNAYKATSQANYGESNGQLGQMSDGGFEAAVSSSPFENGISADNVTAGRKELAKKLGIRVQDISPVEMEKIGKRNQEYGQANGQLGQDTGETFWTAARQIVEQTYQVLKPGAYTAWVCGDFIRNKQRVYFGRQWMELCQAVGFEPVEWAVAWKTEYKGNQLDVFSNDHEKRIDRVSFFRRLANNKSHANEYWETIPEETKNKYIDDLTKELWHEYQTILDSSEPEYPPVINVENLREYKIKLKKYEELSKQKKNLKHPTEKKILDYAKMTAWVDDQCPQLSEATILNEDVIFMRKPL